MTVSKSHAKSQKAESSPAVDRTEGADAPESVNDLMRRRREELEALRAQGIAGYAYAYDRTTYSADIIGAFTDGIGSPDVRIAGRIMSVRRMGKASFFHLQDERGRIQVYLKRDDIGERYDIFRLLDIGDIVGVAGFVFRTRAGEVSVHASSFELLAKSLRPLPVVKEKAEEDGSTTTFDPFSDKELRYRQRYVDLIVNPAVRDVFVKRARICAAIRSHLDGLGYLEVETPVLQPIYGGAFARPFVTHHNALDIDLYLRIADELYLKRLIVGGYEGVYEFAKDFRNEGMDKMHNPEFTMLELYVAYKDYRWMMDLVERLVAGAAAAVNGTTECRAGGRTINLAPPWKRLTMRDAIAGATGIDIGAGDETALRRAAEAASVETKGLVGKGAIIDAVFGAKVEPDLIDPTIIMDYPLEMSPLAKPHRDDPGIAERFEVIVGGKELCNAFSELNDPLDQRRRFEEQMKERSRGHLEAQMLDEDYIRALEYGMPPAAGLGVGIDRLTMLLTGAESIRDVVFFPQMKPEK